MGGRWVLMLLLLLLLCRGESLAAMTSKKIMEKRGAGGDRLDKALARVGQGRSLFFRPHGQTADE